MAFALRQNDDPRFGVAADYYAAAKREPTASGSVSVEKTVGFTPFFLDMLKTLANLQQKDVVLVCHGTPSGFYMNVSSSSDVSASNSILKHLLKVVDDSGNEEKRKGFTNDAAITDVQLTAILAAIKTIRDQLAANLNIHIRGCNMGANKDNLDTLRALLGAKLVSAPKCEMLYVPFSPDFLIPSLNLEQWKLKNAVQWRRREFSVGASTLIAEYLYAGSTSKSLGAITKISDLPTWFNQVYGNTTHGRQRSGAVAAMWTDSDYALPHESSYTAQIVTST